MKTRRTIADFSEREPEEPPAYSPTIIRQLSVEAEPPSKPLHGADLRLMEWRWAFTLLTPVSGWSVLRRYDQHDPAGLLISSFDTLACLFCGLRGWLLRRRCRRRSSDPHRTGRENMTDRKNRDRL